MHDVVPFFAIQVIFYTLLQHSPASHATHAESPCASQHLLFATDFTPDLIAVAQGLLQQIYRPGIRYHRAGVYLAEIGLCHVIQPDLFGGYDGEQEEKKARLMAALNVITDFCDRDTIFFGAQRLERSW